MGDGQPFADSQTEVETALLDAELFIKYGAPDRAIKSLQSALVSRPRSVLLRERLREIASSNNRPEEAARQCLSLASIYIERDDLETAHDRLLEAKQLDARINIAAGLEAIRRARRPDLHRTADAQFEKELERRAATTLSGDLSAISIFDVVQVLENARLTGSLSITGETRQGRVLFNEGRIVDAECGEALGTLAFRLLVEVTSGGFDFTRSRNEFPVRIQALSNTNLILDTLRQMDEEKQEGDE